MPTRIALTAVTVKKIHPYLIARWFLNYGQQFPCATVNNMDVFLGILNSIIEKEDIDIKDLFNE